jgi:hypothetical protein
MFFGIHLKNCLTRKIYVLICCSILLPSTLNSAPALFIKLKDGVVQAGYDQKNFYSPENLIILGSVLGTMGIIANTRLDREFRDGYQHHLRCNGTDKVSHYLEPIGDMPYPHIIILSCFSLNLLPDCIVDLPVINTIADLGSRSVRIILTGAPPMGLFQRLLGSGRPTQGSSRWTPFKNATGMSGHTFLGAVPFLTVYTLTDKKWLQITAIALSPLVGISRINDDKHYLSQVIGGWSCAFIAARSIVKNPEKKGKPEIVTAPGFIGLAMPF